ncbi:MAG TPA: hypothetical protein VF170_11925, partial [Planctomycetaceae bacterium]
GALSGAALGSAAVGALAVFLLLVSLRPFFFPTTYIVDERGVAVRCLGVETRRPWGRLRRFRYDDRGAFLSTRARPGALDSFTGLHLTWAGNVEEVVPVIERHMAEHAAAG